MRYLGIVILLSCLLAGPAAAVQYIGTNPGNAGDTDPTTFHFNANNIDFQMTRKDGTAVTAADVPLLYGTEIVIYQSGMDFIAARNLQVIGADLSGAQWTNNSYPAPGTVAIDPATGRFKFARARWYEIIRLDNDPAYNSWINTVDINDVGDALCEVQEYPSFGVIHSYSRHYTTGTGWSAAQTVWNTSDAQSVKMGLDTRGNVVCLMLVDITGTARLYQNVYTSGSGWGTAVTMDEGSPVANQQPAFAMNKNGDALVGYLEKPGSYDYVYGNHYIANVGWESNIRMDSMVTTMAASSLKSAVNGQGDGVCVYWTNNFYGTGYTIFGNHYLKAGGGWQSQIKIGTMPETYQYFPDVKINDQGDAICVYRAYDASSNYFIYAVRYQAGLGWQSPQRIYTYVNAPSSGYAQPRLIMNATGNAFCVFCDEINGVVRIRALQYTPLQGWTGPVYVDKTSGGDVVSDHIGLDMDQSGFAVCTFTQKETVGSTYGRVMANMYYPQDGWQGPQLTDKTDATASVSAVKLNQKGQGIMGFGQADGSSYTRAYARLFETDIPGDNVQLLYSAVEPTPTATALPAETTVSLTHRKFHPLLGQSLQIDYALAAEGVVRVNVYDLRGSKVLLLLDEFKSAGSYSVLWDGKDRAGQRVASGIYIVKIKGPGFELTKKVAVIK